MWACARFGVNIASRGGEGGEGGRGCGGVRVGGGQGDAAVGSGGAGAEAPDTPRLRRVGAAGWIMSFIAYSRGGVRAFFADSFFPDSSLTPDSFDQKSVP